MNRYWYVIKTFLSELVTLNPEIRENKTHIAVSFLGSLDRIVITKSSNFPHSGLSAAVNESILPFHSVELYFSDRSNSKLWFESSSNVEFLHFVGQLIRFIDRTQSHLYVVSKPLTLETTITVYHESYFAFKANPNLESYLSLKEAKKELEQEYERWRMVRKQTNSIKNKQLQSITLLRVKLLINHPYQSKGDRSNGSI